MKQKGLFGFVGFVMVLSLVGMACGASDVTGLFATDTPTPTQTYTPSPTVTPSPTPTKTSTPTPVPTGVSKEETSNGSTLFTDYDNKYRLTLPPDWVIIPVNQEDFAVAMDELAQEDPDLVDAAEAFRNMNPDILRMAALNKDPSYLKDGSASNITITAIEDPLFAAMPLPFLTGVLEEAFTQQGMKVLTTGVNSIDNDHGVEVQYIDVEQSVNSVKVVQRLVVFLAKGKLIMVTITAHPDFQAEIFPSADEIGKSIELLK